jgi:hypothetical protein
MTIFRCDLIDPNLLTYTFTSANDPDIIGVEVALDGNVLIDCAMDQMGQTSVLFDQDGGQMEFDLAQLRQVLDKCEGDLIAWREGLMVAGGIWEGRK